MPAWTILRPSYYALARIANLLACEHRHGEAGVVVERVAVPEWASDLLLRRPEQADVLVLPQRVKTAAASMG